MTALGRWLCHLAAIAACPLSLGLAFGDQPANIHNPAHVAALACCCSWGLSLGWLIARREHPQP